MATIHIGKLSTHPSHQIAVHRGLFYCRRCGSYSTSRHLRKLSFECKARTQHGERALAAIARDQLPDKVSHWPQLPLVPNRETAGLTTSEQVTLSEIVQAINRVASQPSQSTTKPMLSSTQSHPRGVQPDRQLPGCTNRARHSLDDSEPDSPGQLSEGSD
jgi:hypothetical protein